MELFVLLFLLRVVNISLKISHPLFLGIGLLILTAMATGLICFFGSFYGFRLFIVIIGGVLVVFAYTISLIPFRQEKRKRKRETKRQEEEEDEAKLNLIGRGIAALILIALCCFRLKFTIENGFGGFGSFSEMFYFTDDWSTGMVWIGIILFLVMVFCSNIAGNYEGALCG